MILTVEIPAEGRPHCWFAFNEDDFVAKVRIARHAMGGVVFEKRTPRQLLAARGDEAPQAGIAHLAASHGWDTPLYRADYLLAPGHYQTEEVSEFVAHVALLAHALKGCRVYVDEEQAMEALHNDPLYAGREGFHAHMALREQLIALEVLSDDL